MMMKRTIKMILNQAVDIIFGLLALGLLILHYVRLDKLNESFNYLSIEQIQEEINGWQEINFLWLVVGYAIFNIICKAQTNLRNENILKGRREK